MNLSFTDYARTHSERCGTPNWFESGELVQTFTHAISVFTFPFHVYTAWCIICKSPSRMSNSKWYLLALHLWQASFDVMICSLVTPFFFFPCLCGAAIGLLRVFRVPPLVQLYLGQVCLSGTIASLVVAIESRHNIMVETRFKMTRRITRKLFYLFIYLFAIVFLLPFYFEQPDQYKNKLIFLQENPCPPPEFLENSNLFFTTKPVLFVITCVIFVAINLIFALYFFFHSLYFILYVPEDIKISKNTRNAQVVAFYSLSIGGIIPIVYLSVPALFYGMSILSGYYNQVLNNLGTISLSFHGLCATSSIVFAVPPYREFTFKLLRLDKLKTRRTDISRIVAKIWTKKLYTIQNSQ